MQSLLQARKAEELHPKPSFQSLASTIYPENDEFSESTDVDGPESATNLTGAERAELEDPTEPA